MQTESESSGNTDLYVIIETPQRVLWQGTAAAVSSRNSAGAFDILPDHANMVTLIEKQPIMISAMTGAVEFTFEKAVLAVQENRVIIYTDIAVTDAP